ncbi:MAG: hypothetical protein KDJ19_08445 [Hyphomicrobiaceae bacterium]|nr:hypothetical protein [Hyphomicrobiaceae bacterium]MCC0023362.1 tetratricopeptide repeat protein [Hyphomicrobiaceae bacterium]
MAYDPLGNEVSLSSKTGLSGIEDFVDGFLAYETKAGRVLRAASDDSECFLAQVYAGLIAMFSEAPDAPKNALLWVQRADGVSGRANRREKMMLEMLRAWMHNDVPRALRIGDEVIADYPTDLVALKLHQIFNFNMGNADEMLRIANAGLPANQGNAYMHGMLAFAHEQCHHLDEAEASARRAIDLKYKEPWAHHALAHVMLTQGRVPEGVAFLTDASTSWTELNSFMHTHNWWHLALFHISMGDFDKVLEIYDRECWSQDRTYSQDQVGAVSLLARIEIAGGDVGSRWAELGAYLKSRDHDTVLPFLSLQYLYGLSKAGLGEARELLEAIERRAANAPPFESKAWREVAVPAANGIIDYVEGRYETAAAHLSKAMPRMMEIGGSHAQRDLFAQILLDAHIKAGHVETAREMLESRLKYDPNGAPLNRMLAETYEKLGLLDNAAEARTRRYQAVA